MKNIFWLWIMLSSFLLAEEGFFVATKAEVYRNNGQMIYYNNGYLKVGGDRNWRLNNPGNLKHGKFTKENGAIGSDGVFAIFPTFRVGYLAQAKLLNQSKYKNERVKDFIKIYSPASDGNDVEKYTNFLTKRIKNIKNKRLGSLPNEKLYTLIWWMSIYEGMHAGKIYKKKKK